jgi:hypothetical protein
MIIKDKSFTSKQVFTSQNEITLEGCSFIGIKDVALTFNKCKGVHVKNCTFSECGGVYAVSSSDIVIEHCTANNIHSPKPRGQFFQSNHCKGPIWVHHNFIKCDPTKTYSGSTRVIEDIINLHKTYCSEQDKAIIEYNNVDHGGISPSGGGLLIGDNGGSWQIIRYNKLHTPGQYGIACAGGENMAIVGNEVYSSKTSVSNVGMYVWPAKSSTPDIKNVIVKDNKVNWISKKTGYPNPFWKGDRVYNLTCTNNSFGWEGVPEFTTFLDGSISNGSGFYWVNIRTGAKVASTKPWSNNGDWTIEYIPSEATSYVEFHINGVFERREGVAPYIISCDRFDKVLSDGTVVSVQTSYGSDSVVINVAPASDESSSKHLVFHESDLEKVWYESNTGEFHIVLK